MLNIPDSVKSLFKQDGVYKNFRAHFPNGELADITNENIVQESVKFTESVCSQDVFKFGLTEASTIEFETVGVANMYGMTIECSCEIDCSSLSAADKADIAAGTWDGTWDSVNEVFAVPYGTFRVESCPRDHQAMAHRRVTAYTPEGGEFTSPFEEWKIAQLGAKMKYEMRPAVLATAAIAYRKPSLVPTLTGNSYSGALSWNTDESRVLCKLKKTDGTAIEIYIVCGGSSADFSFYTLPLTRGYAPRMISSFENVTEPPQAKKDEAVSFIVDFLESKGVDAAQSGWGSLEEIALNAMENRWGAHVFYRFNVANTSYAIDDFYSDKRDFFPLPVGDCCICPFYMVDKNVSDADYGSVGIPYVMYTTEIVCREPLEQGSRFSLYNSPTLPTAKTILVNNSGIGAIKIALENTNAQRTPNGRKFYTFIDSFSVDEIARGIAEINAWFMKPSRASGYDVLRLSSASPVSVPPGEYSQMWFDEYNVEPIGTIRYSYTDEAGEEQVVDYQFGEGASVYDVSDNEVLKLMDGADPSVIEAMLDAFFIPNIAPVNFVPIDLNMKGLPYIEAGDALSVTAQDGTVCASYALRQEINGVQVLEAQIDSQSGLIIESEAAT